VADRGGFELADYRKVRGYAEITLSGGEGNAQSAEDNSGWSYSIAPRAICDLVPSSTTLTCGYGAVLSLEGFEPALGSTLAINLSAEKVGTTTQMNLKASSSQSVFNGAGAVISTMGAQSNGSLELGHKLEMRF
jgi:hypothetical protein